MIPCAFFKDGECAETMEAHIEKGLEIIDALYIGRNYDRFLGDILDIDMATARDLLRKAYALHDVGKCLEVFQKKRASFGFHEFYSALVALKFFERLGEVGKITSAAILLHHHDWIRNKTPKKQGNLKLCEECINLIESIIKEEIPSEVPWIETSTFFMIMEDAMRKNLRGVYALLLPVVVGDNYAAALNRAGKKSALGREIFEVLKVRGWDFARGFSGGL